MDVLFNFATKNRPDKFFRCLDNISEFSAGVPYKVLVKIDNDDLNDYGKLEAYPEVVLRRGDSGSKIHAINRDIDLPFDILMNHSDDMMFVASWDRVLTDMPSHLDAVLHYPDGNRIDLMTYSIIGRKYYDRTGYVYHPDYSSLWCDNEAQQVAKITGCYLYFPFQLFDHQHPAFRKGQYDSQYQQTEAFYHADQQVFNRRKERNFDL